MLIGQDDEKLGVISIDAARELALDNNIDLVQVSAGSIPVVCKLMDYGKHLYKQSKNKKGSAKAKPLKQIEIRPSTENGDLNTKVSQIKKFLIAGHKVKVSVKYKGRELSHIKIGVDKLNNLVSLLSNEGRVDGKPCMEGRKYQLTLSPLY
jgi:translation initiation factor IF-3